MTLSRPVNPRATRMALMAASVPELTRRSISMEGTAPATSSASSTSPPVGAPKLAPRAAASWTARTTAGWAWPRTSGPQEPSRSRYSLPSVSRICGPWPLAMKGGVPPTAPKERTGLLTPPGMRRRARSNKDWEECCTGPLSSYVLMKASFLAGRSALALARSTGEGSV